MYVVNERTKQSVYLSRMEYVPTVILTNKHWFYDDSLIFNLFQSYYQFELSITYLHQLNLLLKNDEDEIKVYGNLNPIVNQIDFSKCFIKVNLADQRAALRWNALRLRPFKK